MVSLMTINSISLINSKNQIKYKQNNIKNILHAEGEEFILKSILKQISLPDSYYVGLDLRSSLSREQTIYSIEGEPAVNNYKRQEISSWDFSGPTTNSPLSKWVAKSQPIVFSAVSSTNEGWGPVKNIFLTTLGEKCLGNSCKYLISSASLDSPLTLINGDRVVLEMNLSIFS